MPSSYANGLGLLTITLWGSLGLLGKMVSNLPPFFVLAICFSGASIMGIVLARLSQKPVFDPSQLARNAVIGGFTIFLYHFLYFRSFHYAPAIEVSLLNYLWPAFVVILGNLFFSLRSGPRGYIAVLFGFLGVIVLFGANPDSFSESKLLLGYGLALSGAITWAAYSNIRRVALGDTLLSVTGICSVAAALSIISSIAAEEIPTITRKEFWALTLLTIGPAGGAFYLWDVALKKGNTVLLATLGYFAPVISTVLLVVFGYAEPSLRIGLAASMIAFGGVISVSKGDLNR